METEPVQGLTFILDEDAHMVCVRVLDGADMSTEQLHIANDVMKAMQEKLGDKGIKTHHIASDVPWQSPMLEISDDHPEWKRHTESELTNETAKHKLAKHDEHFLFAKEGITVKLTVNEEMEGVFEFILTPYEPVEQEQPAADEPDRYQEDSFKESLKVSESPAALRVMEKLEKKLKEKLPYKFQLAAYGAPTLTFREEVPREKAKEIYNKIGRRLDNLSHHSAGSRPWFESDTATHFLLRGIQITVDPGTRRIFATPTSTATIGNEAPSVPLRQEITDIFDEIQDKLEKMGVHPDCQPVRTAGGFPVITYKPIKNGFERVELACGIIIARHQLGPDRIFDFNDGAGLEILLQVVEPNESQCKIEIAAINPHTDELEHNESIMRAATPLLGNLHKRLIEKLPDLNSKIEAHLEDKPPVLLMGMFTREEARAIYLLANEQLADMELTHDKSTNPSTRLQDASDCRKGIARYPDAGHEMRQ